MLSDVTVGELARRIDDLSGYIRELPDRLDARFVSREVFDIKCEQLDEKMGDLRVEVTASEQARLEARRWRIATAVAGAAGCVTALITLLH